MWCVLLFPLAVLAQNPLTQDSNRMAENVDNLRKLYGIATRIMELGGSFMGQNSGGTGSSSVASGVRNFEADNTVTGGTEYNSELMNLQKNFGLLGLPMQSSTVQPRPAGIQGLLNTFFGSSVDETEPLPSPPTPRPRPANIFGLLGGPLSQQRQQTPSSNIGQINLWELFGVTRPTTTTTQAPIERILNPQIGILNALMRGNAQPERSSQVGNPSLLSQFFG
ncbi:hypothetical protein DICVIV_13630 [Dictyocaulus viviparus]|uniref:Uncharacterized protein n=1 Tax=Dictyocaulus viviparus TaxID=29172 RepID=A0A0D8X9V6_DICVI|nr:hypothetical protein DICVIV_13630 [Dictyocaulus viviparus]